MTQTILHPTEKTLGDYIKANYPTFKIVYGYASLEMDITHGLELDVSEVRHYGSLKSTLVTLSPYVKWTDGGYRPVYFDSDYCLKIESVKF